MAGTPFFVLNVLNTIEKVVANYDAEPVDPKQKNNLFVGKEKVETLLYATNSKSLHVKRVFCVSLLNPRIKANKDIFDSDVWIAVEDAIINGKYHKTHKMYNIIVYRDSTNTINTNITSKNTIINSSESKSPLKGIMITHYIYSDLGCYLPDHKYASHNVRILKADDPQYTDERTEYLNQYVGPDRNPKSTLPIIPRDDPFAKQLLLNSGDMVFLSTENTTGTYVSILYVP